MVRSKKPDLVFLMETKLRADKMERVRVQLGFDYAFAVDSVGLNGGLALLWMADSKVEIQNYSRWHINAVIRTTPNDQPWKFTGFYSHPEAYKRPKVWSLL